MTSIRHILKTASVAAVLGLALSAAAWAESVKATFVLVNDIYEMDESNGRKTKTRFFAESGYFCASDSHMGPSAS